MSLRLRNLQVDLPPDAHDAGLAWWAAALGGTPRAVDGPYTHLDGVRSPIGVHVQRLDAGVARFHLDLEADDPAGEVVRLVGLGATVVGDAGPSEAATVLTDPAGLLFCVTREGQPQHLSDERGQVVQVRVLMLDAPSTVSDAQAAFWGMALGGEVAPVGEAYPEYTWISGVEGPGGPIEVAVQDVGTADARIHIDLHVDEPTARDREVDRLVTLGASRVADTKHWRVIGAPGGLLACVVPDAPA